MSLYLQIAVGDALYLLDAAHIVEIRAERRDAAAEIRQHDRPLRVVDLRALFEIADAAPGCCVLVAQSDGDSAAIIADRIEGLVELGDEELRSVPPIGPIGSLIDAVSLRADYPRPALRLRAEQVLGTIAAAR